MPSIVQHVILTNPDITVSLKGLKMKDLFALQNELDAKRISRAKVLAQQQFPEDKMAQFELLMEVDNFKTQFSELMRIPHSPEGVLTILNKSFEKSKTSQDIRDRILEEVSPTDLYLLSNNLISEDSQVKTQDKSEASSVETPKKSNDTSTGNTSVAEEAEKREKTQQEIKVAEALANVVVMGGAKANLVPTSTTVHSEKIAETEVKIQ